MRFEWSADGQWIAYAIDPVRSVEDTIPTLDVWVVRADGTNAHLLAAGVDEFTW
jgi:hypothetical protein